MTARRITAALLLVASPAVGQEAAGRGSVPVPV
jgi:hypothetical protein